MGELKATDSVILNYPVDYVYRTVTDIASYSKWWPHEIKSELAHLDPAIIGTTINVQNGAFVKWQSVISGFKTNRLLAIDYVDGAWIGKTAWRFEGIPEGTKITMDIDISCNRLWLKAVSKIMNLSKMHSRQMQKVFRNLNNYLTKNFDEYNIQHTGGGISVSYIDHLTLMVKDIDLSARFYKDVFRVENISTGSGETILKFGSQKIRLVKFDNGESPPKNEVVFRMALNTPLEKVRAILKEKGVEAIAGPMNNSAAVKNNDIFFIKDPDGYIIALMQSNNK